MNMHEWSYRVAFDRNRGLVPDEHQEKIQEAHVAIAGLGGVGGIYATTLARLGVGHFSIADLDRFELPNTNRQHGSGMSTMNARKVETIERMIRDINPAADVHVFDVFAPETANDFLKGVTVALDGIDFFAIAPRRLLYRECRALNIPVLGAGPIGFGSSMLNFDPRGMSFDENYAIEETMSEQEQTFQFALGLSPLLLHRSYFAPKHIDFVGYRAPSSVLGTLACANMIGCEAYKVIAGLPYESAPVSWQFDPHVRKFHRCNLWGGNRNPIQRLKKWYYARLLSQK